MLYSDEDVRAAGLDWLYLIDCIEDAARCLYQGDYKQPLKPYLRYRQPNNRIIAMPAYIGGAFQRAGVKWISSFPGNLARGLPRADSVTVLNDADTGQVRAIFRSPLLSVIRTAAVSGVVLRKFANRNPDRRWRIGIVGWGPIGQAHADMCRALLGDRIQSVSVYDVRKPKAVQFDHMQYAGDRSIRFRSDWRDMYEDSDIFITCTASPYRYIDRPPACGQLLLHVSLRDYKPEALASVRTVIVDDWDEVCREDTDIERLHSEQKLQPSDCILLANIVCAHALDFVAAEDTVLFAPMGMAVFDIAVASIYELRIRENQKR